LTEIPNWPKRCRFPSQGLEFEFGLGQLRLSSLVHYLFIKRNMRRHFQPEVMALARASPLRRFFCSRIVDPFKAGKKAGTLQIYGNG
jgi:hypothetical protein